MENLSSQRTAERYIGNLTSSYFPAVVPGSDPGMEHIRRVAQRGRERIREPAMNGEIALGQSPDERFGRSPQPQRPEAKRLTPAAPVGMDLALDTGNSGSKFCV